MRLNSFYHRAVAADRQPTLIVDQGWGVLRALELGLLESEDATSAAAIRSAMAAVAATMLSAQRLLSRRSRRAQRTRLDECFAAIEHCLVDLALPEPARRDLDGFFGNLIDFGLVLRGVPPIAPAADRTKRPAEPLPLTVPSGLLYQARAMLLPAERMAVGAVRREVDGSRLEAIFDVTGVATQAHVDADPQRLLKTFIDIDNAGAVYAFWAHSQPGEGEMATMPSLEDRDTFQRRLRQGDSRWMIAAIFSTSHVRFLRADPNLELVGAGDQVRIVGPGLRPSGSGCDTYAFAT